MPKSKTPDAIKIPPFETEDLRKNLVRFLDTEFPDPVSGGTRKVGNFRWGAYAFFDYDGEPIYVGQTNEQLRTRIRRHLTNQRTDAVAMSVLDPFEVYEIQVWPVPTLQNINKNDRTELGRRNLKEARDQLNALENQIYKNALSGSKFKVILDEKDPPPSRLEIKIPASLRQTVVSPEVHKIRSHPDFRLARRALIIARLAQVISERKVQGGLRRVLLTQAKRLQWLAQRRYEALGGAASVEVESDADNPADTDET